jgi:mono/diheme cytochrome c family protein
LTGADLYRLGCQSCHKADGSGAPPEINAIIGPVQATSAPLMERRMRERGRPISSAFARELASGSKKDLLDRLHKGGQKMPSFVYLTDKEVDALIRHLESIAGLPGAGKQKTLTEPVTRVGELLVKGTCHICHDATGRWPDPQELLQGSVPPIAGFTTEKTMPEVVRKVRHGATVVMGSLPLPYRGRMPVFDYLSDDEVVSAYLYLVTYPP